MWKKISGLPRASSVDGSESFPLVQSGATKQALLSQIVTFFQWLFITTNTAQTITGVKTLAQRPVFQNWASFLDVNHNIYAVGWQWIYIEPFGTTTPFHIQQTTGDLFSKWQNRTWYGTNYTPTVSFSSSGSVGGYTVQSWRYWLQGKRCYWSARCFFTKWTGVGTVELSLPFSPNWHNDNNAWWGWIADSGTNTATAWKWMPMINGARITFMKLAATNYVAAADLWAGNIEINVSFMYEIA
jgi:hypothetical protein